MDIRDIESDESEWHKNDPDHDCVYDDDDSEIREAQMCYSDFIQHLQNQNNAPETRDSKSDVSYEFEREEGEWSEIVDGEIYELTITVACLAIDPFFRVEHEGDFSETEPVDESSVHPVLLAETEIGIHHASVEEAIVGRPRFEFEFRHGIEEHVEQLWSDSF